MSCTDKTFNPLYAQKKKLFRCELCLRHTAIKRGTQLKKQIFFCSVCKKYFSRSLTREHTLSVSSLVADHLEGLSYRQLALRRGVEKKKLCAIVNDETAEFVENFQVTEYFKDQLKYSGNLVLDGKYIPVKDAVVAKGVVPRSKKRRKVPHGKVLVWGADYDSHDIPHNEFGGSENFTVYKRYFARLQSLGYPLKSLTLDDVSEAILAAKKYFPRCVFQLCHKHYLAKVSRMLNVRSILVKIKAREKKLEKFFRQFPNDSIPRGRMYAASQVVCFANEIAEIEFAYELILDFYAAVINILSAKTLDDANDRIASMEIFFLPRRMKMEFSIKQKSLVKTVWADFKEHEPHLFTYLKYPELHIPYTTNLMEGFNSQIENRLGSIRGFETSDTAKHYVNAWILKRRFTRFTDCKKHFKHLNGKTPLENAGANLSTIKSWIKTFRKRPPKKPCQKR